MNKSLTEAKVLTKLGIPDFRHLTKDKVVSFVSMLPHMDTEVAKKALEQFPEFSSTALSITESLKASVEQAMCSNASNMETFNSACLTTLEGLKERLNAPEISPEEKESIISSMMQVLEMLYRKDTENKEYHTGLIRTCAIFGAVVLVCLASVLGIKAETDRDGI